MNAITLQDAQARLPSLIQSLADGEEFTITDNGAQVAIVTPPPASWPCQPGTANDRDFWMADDFNAPLEDDCALTFTKRQVAQIFQLLDQPPARNVAALRKLLETPSILDG